MGRMGSRLGLVVAGLSFSAISALVLSCSLTIAPRQISFKLHPGEIVPPPASDSAKRPGPAIDTFQYYALALTGPVPNSLKDSLDTATLSVSCLYLGGTVLFPLTFAQLTQGGVSVTLGRGAYTATILGIQSASVSQASSIRQLFQAPFPPQIYRLATVDFNTASTSTVKAVASYSVLPPATQDRVSICTPQIGSLSVFKAYWGTSGDPNSSPVTFAVLEGLNPPMGYAGSSMTEISDLVSPRQLPAASGLHLAYSVFYNLPSPNITPSDINVVVTGTGNTTTYDGLGGCLTTNASPGGFKMAVWDQNRRDWIFTAPTVDVDTYTMKVSGLIPFSALIDNKLLVTIRTTSFTTSSRCVQSKLDAVSIRVTP